MSNSIVRQALETRLATWASAQSPSIPVAYENAIFEKPTDSTWLESILIPNTTNNRETTALHQTYIGLFQVNVWSRKGEGLHDAQVVAESISSLFPVMPKIGSVSIDKPPHVGRPILDDSGWVALPILMSYRYEA